MRTRSEEHTSELQSRGQLVCRLLLEKKQKLTFKRQASTRDLHTIPTRRSSDLDFDDEYKRISEEINELKKAKLRLAQEKKQAESFGEQLNEMESTLKTVRSDVREFDEY